MSSSLRQYEKRSVAEKLAIVAEYEAAPRGERGAVARRHNVDRGLIGKWAGARDRGDLVEGGNPPRRSAVTPKRRSAEIARLRDKLARPKRRTRS